MSYLGKKAQHAEEGEGPWIVSYADMMTLLCCFFVILYSFSQIDDKKFKEFSKEMGQSLNSKKDNEKTKDLADMTPETRQARALHLLVGMLNIGDNIDDVVKKVEANNDSIKGLQAAKEAMKKDAAKIQGADTISDTNKISVVMPLDILFEKATSHLTPSAELRIAQIAENISKIPDVIMVEIEGHTGSQPLSKDKNAPNLWTLSAIQAGIVAETLIKHGVDKSRISVRGMANTEPLFPTKDQKGNINKETDKKNWRIQINLKKKKDNGSKP